MTQDEHEFSKKCGALEPFEEHPTYNSIRIKRQKESKAAIGNFLILRQI